MPLLPSGSALELCAEHEAQHKFWLARSDVEIAPQGNSRPDELHHDERPDPGQESVALDSRQPTANSRMNCRPRSLGPRISQRLRGAADTPAVPSCQRLTAGELDLVKQEGTPRLRSGGASTGFGYNSLRVGSDVVAFVLATGLPRSTLVRW
jgi:hypothetical protein